MSTPANDRAEWLAANRYAHDDAIDPSDALGHDDAPNPTPPHVCGQDPDPWCEVCGAAVRAWMRGEVA